ncbi:MAG: peptidoglycan-associated lipoprotein [Deltaproteobacteria bacterium HGW-Deltaproteobacteria-13]|nr:MAG: peptidoglycan-associated lipoprotein [Deltaproteobacteria bacterium HGW-Deltaproteobacteria-13]
MPENREVVAQEETPMSNIYFDFDKYNLRDEDKKMLKEHADWLMKNEAYRIRIEGNCDERGSEKYNMALGQRRADAAKNYLVKMGVNKKRISTISYGKDRPVDPGHDEAAWAKNRNDHFVLTVYK